MIRPLTIATLLLACGSGLYLYQSKHEVQVLDHTIEQTVRDTGALREQSRLLAAEWTMLNDPERLRQFSNTYLNLKSISPTQFTSLADLDNHLPAAQAETPAHDSEQDAAPVAVETPPANALDPASDSTTTPVVAQTSTPVVEQASTDDMMPVPPVPKAMPVAVVAVVATAAVRPVELRPVEQKPVEQKNADRIAQVRSNTSVGPVRSAVADARQFDQRQFEQRPTDQRPPEQRSAMRMADVHSRPDSRQTYAPAPRPVVVAPVVVAAARPAPFNQPRPVQPRPAVVAGAYASAPTAAGMPIGGSLLGMARGSMPPAPRPVPVSATYNAN